DDDTRALRAAQLDGEAAEGIGLPVRGTDVDTAVGDGGSGVEGAVAAEPGLAGGAPDLSPGARGERVDVTVVGADEEAVPGQRDSAFHLPAGLKSPARASG